MFIGNYKHLAKDNTNFRQVLATGPQSQIVAMSLPAGTDIGMETHHGIDQLFLFIKGAGEAEVGDEVMEIHEKMILLVPAETRHNIRNTGGEDMKLLTIYSPPAHPDGTVQKTKPTSEKAETPPPIPAPMEGPAELPTPPPSGTVQ